MKLHSIPRRIALTSAVLISAAAFLASRPAGQDQDAPEEAPTPLAQEMGGMNRALRGLRRSLGKPELRSRALAAVLIFERHVLAAKSLVPPRANGLEGPARARFLLAYRRAMIAVLTRAMALELAIVEERDAQAKKLLGELIQARDRGHEAFQEKD